MWCSAFTTWLWARPCLRDQGLRLSSNMAGLAGPFRPGRWDVSMNAATSQHATGWEPGRGQGCWWWLRACQAPRCFESFLCDLDHGCRWLLQSQSLATVYESPVYDLKPRGIFSLLCLLDFHIIAQSFRMPSLFPHEFYTKKKTSLVTDLILFDIAV